MRQLVSLLTLCSILISCSDLRQPDVQLKESDTSSFGTNINQLGTSVTRVFQDSHGNYWFASKGAVKYDGETFIRFTTEDGLYSNRIRDFQEDHLGNIYFDTGSGINKYTGTEIVKLTVVNDTTKANLLTDNDLWFAGKWNTNGVYRCDGQSLYYHELSGHPLEKEVRSVNPSFSYNPYACYTTFKDRAGNIWMGGSTFGASRFDGKTLFWISEREMTEVDPGPAMGVRSIVQDKQGDFYFASHVDTKYRVIELDGVLSYEKLAGVPTSSREDVHSDCISMEIDENGHIWMAHYKGGVWKYDGERFKHYPILIKNEEAELFSIYKDRTGVLWLGSHNAGAHRFDGNNFEQFQPKSTNNDR